MLDGPASFKGVTPTSRFNGVLPGLRTPYGNTEIDGSDAPFYRVTSATFGTCRAAAQVAWPPLFSRCSSGSRPPPRAPARPDQLGDLPGRLRDPPTQGAGPTPRVGG